MNVEDYKFGDIVYIYDSYMDSLVRAKVTGYEQRHYVLRYLQYISRNSDIETQAKGTTRRYASSIWKDIESAWAGVKKMFGDASLNEQERENE